MSSKRGKKRKMCTGKVKHKTQEDAESFMHFYHRGDHYINVYRCKYCGLWHIGHMPSFVRKQIKERRRNDNR